jgi:uncharacterized protein (TIGR03084 family)
MASTTFDEVLTDLVAEQDRIEAFLATLSESDWLRLSATPPWSVAGVVLHLAQTDEITVRTLTGGDGPNWHREGSSVDEVMAKWVAEESGPPLETFARWRAARQAAAAALREADPEVRVDWATVPLRPQVLATTRLAEHWAHALDVTEPFDADFPDTDRLRHIAWLGHATLPYAFGRVGAEPRPVYCELTGPSGAVWHFGPEDAPSRITGSMSAFCRVGAQRLSPEASGLEVSGPHAADALRVLRNYAA